MCNLKFIVGAVVATAMLLIARASDAQLTLTDLGADLRPRAIDNEGRITGQLLSTQTAVIWNGSSFVDLGTLGGPTSIGNAIESGQVVGTSDNMLGRTSAMHYAGITNELDPVFFGATVTGVDINLLGQKLGNIDVDGTKLIGIWSFANFFSTALNGLPAYGLGLNDLGDGVAVRADQSTGIYWNGANPQVPELVFQDFVPSGGVSNERLLAGILDGTTAAVYRVDVSQEPTPIPNIGSYGNTSSVAGLNNSNQLVGNTDETVFFYDYETNRLIDLNAQTKVGDPFDTLLEVTAINDNGLIVGTGMVGDEVHAFVATLTLGLLGDYNGDNAVGPADYDKWVMDFGMQVPAGSGADGNANGIIDAADYTVWRDHLGQNSGSAAMSPSSVPEPTTLAIAATLILCCAGIRRRT